MRDAPQLLIFFGLQYKVVTGWQKSLPVMHCQREELARFSPRQPVVIQIKSCLSRLSGFFSEW